MVARVTAQEIADKYGCSLITVRRWMSSDVWPDPIGKRGRWLEFDATQVDRVHSEHFARQQSAVGGPAGDLLSVAEIASYTGLSASTIRADIARGRFGEPDDEAGAKRWRRSTVDRIMAGRRRYRRAE